MKIRQQFYALPFLLVAVAAYGQTSQTKTQTKIRGNTEINVRADNMTAIATGENNVAKNRVGVIQGNKRGDTKITVDAATVVGGRNRKACTNIGSIVSEECK
jgi:hypothetical protein